MAIPRPEHRRMRLGELDPAYYNPRRIKKEALEGLQNTIGEFGLVQEIVWNKRNRRIVGGHQRVKALHALGETEADVTVVDLDDIKEKALNMALNNPEIAGEFTEKAEDILKEIEAADADLYASIRLDALDDLIGGGGNDGAEDEELIDVKVQALPSMTWVLIGIPTVRFGEVAHVVEAVTTVPDVICEVTANGG